MEFSIFQWMKMWISIKINKKKTIHLPTPKRIFLFFFYINDGKHKVTMQLLNLLKVHMFTNKKTEYIFYFYSGLFLFQFKNI